MTSASSEVELVYDIRPDGSIVARFADDEVNVSRGRRRSYPGLVGESPDTIPFYEFVVEALAKPSQAVDFGCGSGAGTRLLAEAWGDVTGVDADPEAVRFASCLNPQGRFVEADLVWAEGAHDLVVMVDVLGQVLDPFSVIRNLWHGLQDGGELFVAEPRAHSSQLVRSPVRRAFSRGALAFELETAGFDVVSWVSTAPGFVACLARKRESKGAEAFEQARAAIHADAIDRASVLLGLAANDPCPSVRVAAELLRADIYLSARSGDLAASSYMNAAKANPQDARPARGLAFLLANSGDMAEAHRLASGAAALDPTDALTQALLAQLVEVDSPDYAYACWRSANRLAPDDPWIVSEYAQRAVGRGDETDALQSIDRLQRYGDPMDAAMHLTLAKVLASVGRVSDAHVEAQIARAQDPAIVDIDSFMRSFDATLPPPAAAAG